MNRRFFLALLTAFLPTTGLAQEGTAPPTQAKPVTVFLLRHAETAADTRENTDPELSAEGQQRTQDLVQLLGHAGITHAFSTEFNRTRGVLVPLAQAAKVEIETIKSVDSDGQLTALLELPPGSVAVVAGHSNTIPRLVSSLGGSAQNLVRGNLDHDSYDRVFCVTMPSGGSATSTIELRYGKPCVLK